MEHDSIRLDDMPGDTDDEKLAAALDLRAKAGFRITLSRRAHTFTPSALAYVTNVKWVGEPDASINTPATTFDATAVRARCDAATEGPWRLSWEGQELRCVQTNGSEWVAEWTYVVNPSRPEQYNECDTANAAFIAHARTDFPQALDALAAAEALVLPLNDLDRILRHLMADGTREGLLCADLLNSRMGRSARRRALTEEDNQ